MSIEKWPEDARLAYHWLEGFCEQRSDLALSKLGQLRRGLQKHYEPTCKCGQPWVLNTIHRANTPCYRAADPREQERGGE